MTSRKGHSKNKPEHQLTNTYSPTDAHEIFKQIKYIFKIVICVDKLKSSIWQFKIIQKLQIRYCEILNYP